MLLKVIPAIDLKEGCCVRLLQGDPNQETIYSDNPIEIALRWEEKGAPLLHVVDLDGAFQGSSVNHKVIESLANQLKIPFQLGGGLRSYEAVSRAFSLGVSRVVLGTVAVENQVFLEEMLNLFGENILVGLDARYGKVAVRGWTEESGINALTLAKKMEELGVKEIIYTDIHRDGTLKGPDLTFTEELARETNLSIIVSGGVSRLEDLIKIKELSGLGVTGVIVGKALYSGSLELEKALKIAKE